MIDILIAVIIACIFAGVALWLVRTFLPEAYPPARYIIGGIVLVYLLIQLKPFLPGL